MSVTIGLFVRRFVESFVRNNLTIGKTPEISQIENLVEWLENNHPTKVFMSYSISQDCGLKKFEQSTISGVFAAPVSTKMKDYVMWFREEQSLPNYYKINTKNTGMKMPINMLILFSTVTMEKYG